MFQIYFTSIYKPYNYLLILLIPDSINPIILKKSNHIHTGDGCANI